MYVLLEKIENKYNFYWHGWKKRKGINFYYYDFIT